MPDLFPLSSMLNDMNRYKDAEKVEDTYKIRAIDAALRRFRRKIQAPWMLIKSTLRVFDGILEYPVQDDLDELAFFDDEKKEYYSKPDFRYTSIKEFYNDPNNRNDLAMLWDRGSKYLGVRYKGDLGGNRLLNNCEKASDWTASGTASSPTLDTVFYKEGQGSIKFTVTAGTATMKGEVTDFTDSNYKRNYEFLALYLPAVPTSISIRLHVDASNYLEVTGITTQFSRQAMNANEWNIFGIDLNLATATGTVTTASTFSYIEFDIVGASAGTYYVDSVYLRRWSLLDMWYYSKYYVALTGSTVGNQEYFLNSSEVPSTDSQLIGDTEFRDVIIYEALEDILIDTEKKYIKDEIKQKKEDAWFDFYEQYPSLSPVISTTYYQYEE